MENSGNQLLVTSSIPMVQNQLGFLKCFRILVEYVFVILFINNFVLFIFPRISSVIAADVAAAYIANTGDLLSRYLGLLAAGYFVFLMVRKYYPAPSINLSLSQVGFLRCSKMSASIAVILGIVFAIIFEYFLPNRYPADPELLENINIQSGEVPFWITVSLLFTTVGIAPFVEEFFFRGFLYRAFSECSGKVISALVVTGIFVLLHYQVFSYWVALVSLLVGSITLILIREKSGSLIPPILLHQFYNLGVAIFQ